jgi:hypothetical protein
MIRILTKVQIFKTMMTMGLIRKTITINMTTKMMETGNLVMMMHRTITHTIMIRIVIVKMTSNNSYNINEISLYWELFKNETDFWSIDLSWLWLGNKMWQRIAKSWSWGQLEKLMGWSIIPKLSMSFSLPRYLKRTLSK